jgi:4-amino-4-deoxy-L-arabinose transferase-like glycosyltransferase
MALNKKSFILPMIITLFVIFIYAIYYWQLLPEGLISHYDEYNTLDRSNGFLIHDDWLAVYSNNEPNFKKPPLQYWLTAMAISESDDPEFALRIWSYLFGLGLLIATGLLAYSIAPSNPYIIPSAVLIVSGSSLLWDSAISAMLDAGAAFFFTLSVAGFLLALRRPAWWYLVAVATGLGALQKVPVGFLAVAVLLLLVYTARKYHDLNTPEILANRHFRTAATLVLIVLLSWPVLQISRFGVDVIWYAYIKQMLIRFAPVGDETDTHLRWWLWFIRDGAGLWIPAILSLFALPLVSRKPESISLPVLFVAFAMLMTMATGEIYSRYLLIILPVLAASLAAVFVRIIPAGSIAVLLACVLVIIAGDPFRINKSLDIFESSQEQYLSLMENYSAALSDDETPVFCSWSKNRPRIYPGAFSYYASNGMPFLDIDGPEELLAGDNGAIVRNYRGLCQEDELEQLEGQLAILEPIEKSGNYIHWAGVGTVSRHE